MTRRALFLLLLAMSARAERSSKDVEDCGPYLDRLNEFSEIMNGFVAKLNSGVLDLKLWARARRAFHRVEVG